MTHSAKAPKKQARAVKTTILYLPAGLGSTKSSRTRFLCCSCGLAVSYNHSFPQTQGKAKFSLQYCLLYLALRELLIVCKYPDQAHAELHAADAACQQQTQAFCDLVLPCAGNFDMYAIGTSSANPVRDRDQPQKGFHRCWLHFFWWQTDRYRLHFNTCLQSLMHNAHTYLACHPGFNLNTRLKDWHNREQLLHLCGLRASFVQHNTCSDRVLDFAHFDVSEWSVRNAICQGQAALCIKCALFRQRKYHHSSSSRPEDCATEVPACDQGHSGWSSGAKDGIPLCWNTNSAASDPSCKSFAHNSQDTTGMSAPS